MKVKPWVTEKSMKTAASGQYTFRAGKKDRKTQISKAIENEYKVNVVAIRTMNIKQKGHWKKAVVTLKKDQKIDGFGGEK